VRDFAPSSGDPLAHQPPDIETKQRIEKRIEMRWIKVTPALMAGLMLLTSWTLAGAQSNYPESGNNPTSSSVTGTIVSMNDDQVVVRTAMGEETYRLSTSVDRTGMTVGNQVTVWYDAPTSVGERPMVTRIALGDASATTPRTTTTGVDRTTTTNNNDELPATASLLPLLGLLGLLALVGSVAIGNVAIRRGTRSLSR
jgi:hypothetical protein